MNILDLLAMGIETKIYIEEHFIKDMITFRFRKDDMHYHRTIQYEDVLTSNVDRVRLEDILCKEVEVYYERLLALPRL